MVEVVGGFGGGGGRDLIRQSISETPSLMRFPSLQVGQTLIPQPPHIRTHVKSISAQGYNDGAMDSMSHDELLTWQCG